MVRQFDTWRIDNWNKVHELENVVRAHLGLRQVTDDDFVAESLIETFSTLIERYGLHR